MDKLVEIYLDSYKLREKFIIWLEEEGLVQFEDWVINYADYDGLEVDLDNIDEFIIRIGE